MRYRVISIAAAVAVLLMAACGDSGERAPTSISPTASPTTTVSATAPSTTTDASAATADPSQTDALAETQTVAIVNGTIIDGTGGEPMVDGVVVIADGVVSAVGTSAEIEIPAGAAVLDAGGGTILPGLVDTHAHHLERLQMTDGEFDEFRVGLALTGPLQGGTTTFRDAGSAWGHTRDLSELRDALAVWSAPLPRVVVSGPLIAHADSRAINDWPNQSVGVADVAEAEAMITTLLDNGVDQIKLLIERFDFRPKESPNLTQEQIDAMVLRAHEGDTWVLAHVSDVVEARMALAAGVDEFTHWPGPDRLPDEMIAELVERGVPVGTTFGITTPFSGDVRRLIDAGGTVVISSDAPGVMGGGRLWQELERMVASGMTPMEAIIASTRDAAVTIGLGDVVGTLEVGMAGDLIVVGGDPLDDITSIADLVFVIKGGAIVIGPE